MAKIYKNQEIPKFLLDKRYLFGSVVFVMTFSFLFMAIYTPFSNTVWFDVSNRLDLGMTVAFYIVAVSIMLVSKMLMNANLTFFIILADRQSKRFISVSSVIFRP